MRAIHKQFENAIEAEDVTQAKVFLYYHKAKLNLDLKDKTSGKTMIHRCCEKGSLSVVRLLVDHGASTELQDNEGNTGLHYACEKNDFQLVRFLLNACANVFVKNNKGFSPSEMATESSVKILVEMAMSLNSGSNQIMTLGRHRKPKHTTNNLHQSPLGRRNSKKVSRDHENTNTKSTSNMVDGNSDECKQTNTITTQKIPSFRKARRGSGPLVLCKVKKMNSFGDRKESPRIQHKHLHQHHQHTTNWSDLQALRRSASETDLDRTTDNDQNNDVGDNHDIGTATTTMEIGSKMQKTTNSEQINLIGLTMSSDV